jgi:transcriptional regulator with XRE-family HTH domain
MDTPIGIDFKIARIRAGRKQQDVAQEAGVSQALLSLYESGKRTPSEDVAARLWGVIGGADDTSGAVALEV